MSIVVETAKLNPNCEGCMAAKTALESYKSIAAQAIKKIDELQEKIFDLECELREGCPECPC